MAWETFGTWNGVASLDALRARLSKIRDGARIEGDPAGRIGCSLIAEATFFEQDAWIAPPSDWSPRTQAGARIDLAHGEGARIWQQCLMRAPAPSVPAMREETEERYGTPTLRAPRLGQGIFRIRVLDAYGRACAITSEHSLPVLDAAHIKPYAAGGAHAIGNGLALRSDLHRLFDHGYITVDEDDKLVVGQRLREEFQKGKSYYPLHGRQLALPAEAGLRPDAAALAWHREVRFVG